mmetsp:Transcript_11519/g.31891  ORF Transcript_11519/g.31891 Transcript_11519/m.31891 type:complete len:336 (-) Transcript_11519:76-1083(-)
MPCRNPSFHPRRALFGSFHHASSQRGQCFGRTVPSLNGRHGLYGSLLLWLLMMMILSLSPPPRRRRRRRYEKVEKRLGIDRGAANDDAQFGSLRTNAFQQSQQHVRRQLSFVRFVANHHAVPTQQRIVSRGLLHDRAVRRVQDLGHARTARVVEPNGVRDNGAVVRKSAGFLLHPLGQGNGRHASRLGANDLKGLWTTTQTTVQTITTTITTTTTTPPGLAEVLRQLGTLAAARGTDNHRDTVAFHGVLNLSLVLVNGQRPSLLLLVLQSRGVGIPMVVVVVPTTIVVNVVLVVVVVVSHPSFLVTAPPFGIRRCGGGFPKAGHDGMMMMVMMQV